MWVLSPIERADDRRVLTAQKAPCPNSSTKRVQQPIMVMPPSRSAAGVAAVESQYRLTILDLAHKTTFLPSSIAPRRVASHRDIVAAARRSLTSHRLLSQERGTDRSRLNR